MRTIPFLALALAGSLATVSAWAEGPLHVLANHAWCDGEDDRGDERERYCEVREATWAGGAARTDVDASPNGGIEVRGWDRAEVKLLAKVVATGETTGDARDLAAQVTT